ncbi:MAG: hypothetical protein IKY81_01420 [Methanocorpusculum sp.]|nr:hypothetical protein [Methanocorpusculum sp.]
MRLQGSIQHKACADGSYMKEYQLDEPLSKEFFEYLKYFGRVTALEEMGDGYFSFEKPNWFSIKGFAGDQTVEVRFKRETMEITTDFLYLLFSSFKEGVDLTPLREKEKFRQARIAELLK